ncbi:DNA maturase B, partial [Candidatus Bathyarchaeota archaeon]
MSEFVFYKWTEQDLKDDFKKFLAYAWKQLGLPAPTPVQYSIADYLQDSEKVRRRKIIQAFRGVGKSWITSVYCAWRWWKNHNYRILVVSASKMRSDDFTTFTLRIISEFPVLQHLIPNKGMGDRSSKTAFDVRPSPAAHAPSCKSLGVFSQLAGSRADEVIADDVEVPNNSATQDLREKLIKTAMEFEAIMMPDTGKITYLGTPQTEESIYNKLNERGYERRIWPARFPTLNKDDIYHGQLCPVLSSTLKSDPTWVGEATDPKRFDGQDLSEREAAYG